MIHSVPENREPGREKAGFSAIDIELPTSAANVADITLTSRYPAQGFALNTASEMIVRILEGEVVFECEGEQVSLATGATILVEKNRPYCWVPKEFVRLYVVSTPPWTQEQHKDTPN